ncbi:MAG: cell division protein FtsQ, partial [Burkholderiaceae bacterium]
MNVAVPMPVDVRVMDALSRLLMLGLMGLSMFIVGAWAYQHPAWPVRSLVLVGDVVHQSAPGRRAQLNVRVAGSILSVDVKRVQH